MNNSLGKIVERPTFGRIRIATEKSSMIAHNAYDAYCLN